MCRTLMSVVAAAAVLALGGCAAHAPSDSDPRSLAATGADDAPTARPEPAPLAGQKAGQKALVVRGEGALIRPYAAGSLGEFAADPYVVGVVRGTVTKVEARANDEGSVSSILTVEVGPGPGPKAGSTIRVSEPGGVVPMREVREQFEGKDWQEPLTAADLSRTVDYRMEGFPHSAVGEEIVMLLAEGAGDGVYSLAAKLVPKGAGFGFVDDEPPNPNWSPDVPATVDRLVQGSAPVEPASRSRQ